MKTSLNVFVLLFSCSFLWAQNDDDWTWYEPDSFDPLLTMVRVLDNGEVWTGTDSKIIQQQGTDWIEYSFSASGIPSDYIIDIVQASNGHIWAAGYDGIYEYDPVNDSWISHNPSSSANLNGRSVSIDGMGNVWFATSREIFKYDGSSWTGTWFYEPSLDMNERSYFRFNIDDDNRNWVVTSSSICIDFSPCFTPAGIISFTDTDTVFYQAEDLGVPFANSIALDFNSANQPVAVITDTIGADNYLLVFENGAWSSPELLPYAGHCRQLEIGEGDKIHLFMGDFIAVGSNGNWDRIEIDESRMDLRRSFDLDADNGIYIAGQIGQAPDRSGVMGYLPELNYRARGLVYADENDNGVFDAGELPLPNQILKTTNDSQVTFSDNNGNYSLLFADQGLYEYEALLPKYFSYGSPVDGTYDILLTFADPNANDRDFAFLPDTTAIDLGVSLAAYTNANPGFNVCYSLTVRNVAPKAMEGGLSLNFDDLLTFQSSSLPPTNQSANQLSYDLAPLEGLSSQRINICFSLPPDPNLFGQILALSAAIEANASPDLDLSNNTAILEQEITGPYDPNYILVSPEGLGPQGVLPATTEYLDYTIHFQNIGNDTARNVIIVNPLDPDLDLYSLEVTGASHAYELSYSTEDENLTWTFSNINLVDSLTNEVESNGFIQYRIAIIDPQEGTRVENKADIYFDFNAPILTNTAVTTLEDITTAIDPNPNLNCDFSLRQVGETLQVEFPQFRSRSLHLFDIRGRLMGSYSSSTLGADYQIDIGHLSQGVYIFSLHDELCETAKIWMKQ